MEFDNGDEVELDQRLKPEDGKNLSMLTFLDLILQIEKFGSRCE